MAVTTPDNLYSPDDGNAYALVQDLGLGQDTTQAAFIKRANMYVGTTAQRTAFTTAPEGVHWQDTNGSKIEYVRQAGAWVAVSVTGSYTLQVTGAPGATGTVTFPSGAFQTAPTVMLTKQSSGAAKYIPYAQGITAGGFTVGIYSGDGSNGTQTAIIGWVAFS